MSDDLVEVAQVGARRAFDTDGVVLPMAFIEAHRNPQTGERAAKPHLLSVPLMGDKDTWPVLLRKLIEKFEGTAVVIVTESWSVLHDKKDGDAELTKWVGRVSEHPNATETVSVFYENSAGAGSVYTANIKRDGDGAELAPFEKVGGDTTEGKFTGFFKSKILS